MTTFGDSIPGETPLDDVSGLRIKGITTRSELNELEAANIAKVTNKYLAVTPSRRSAKFTYTWCLNLHKEMFGDVWEWAGKPRTHDLNMGIASHAIPENLATLLQDLENWSNFKIPFDEQAVRLHHGAVRIHPFLNGNGRWARMLANIWLKLHRQPLTLWPESSIDGSSEVREQYLAAIRLADQGDYDALEALHKRFAEQRP